MNNRFTIHYQSLIRIFLVWIALHSSVFAYREDTIVNPGGPCDGATIYPGTHAQPVLIAQPHNGPNQARGYYRLTIANDTSPSVSQTCPADWSLLTFYMIDKDTSDPAMNNSYSIGEAYPGNGNQIISTPNSTHDLDIYFYGTPGTKLRILRCAYVTNAAGTAMNNGGNAETNVVLMTLPDVYVPPVCSITDISLSPGLCNNNNTPNDSTDDYYTSNVTVNFSDNPASGNLVLSGSAIHSSNTVNTVVVGNINTANFHTFTGVRLKANGVSNVIIATFSDDVFCTLAEAATTVNSCSSPPAVCAITSINVSPGACNSNGTPSDSTDDYYTASVTVNFINPPATGDLVLSGAALHSTNSVTSVAVGSLGSSTSHTFTGVRLVANNTSPTIVATFQ